jgi:hypothetical protein
MSELIKTFTFGRNTLKRSVTESAVSAIRSIQRVEQGVDLTILKRDDNGSYNVIRDLISFAGVVERHEGTGRVSRLGEIYKSLHERNKEDAWRWLITRSLWLYVVPNGTDAAVNDVSRRLGISFSFFRTMLGILWHTYSLRGTERFLYYEELCATLADDSVWNRPAEELFDNIREQRKLKGGAPASDRSLLGDLEDEYEIPRDNLNTVLNKAFQQTGLFEYARHGARITGIAISSSLDSVLHNRIRFVLDNPVTYDGGDWSEYLQPRAADLPQEVSLTVTEVEEEELPSEPLDLIVPEAVAAFKDAGLRFNGELVLRFASSLLTKPFVILTGLSGSGKTKLAQAFAAWICPRHGPEPDAFQVETRVQSDKTEYRVVGSDSVAVEFESPDGTRTAIPIALIKEWISCIREKGFDRSTPPRQIRDAVAETTHYSGQINSFESHLKAAAFALLEHPAVINPPPHYEIVSVGADWTAKESCLGYADALSEGKYVRTSPIVDLILRARSDRASPYFLILDEMNLSHVERYFADFLSAMESGQEIVLHGGLSEMEGVPPRVPLPFNLFIVGTVNVDETTYVFSPKVLDRANSLEFTVEWDAVAAFLSESTQTNLPMIAGSGAKFAKAFVVEAARLDNDVSDPVRLKAEIELLFDVLGLHGSGFGFRTVKEISRFMYFHHKLSTSEWEFDSAMDAQVCQKILPKLNGSRRRLEPILCALAVLCYRPHDWDSQAQILANRDELFDESKRAGTLEDEQLHPILSPTSFGPASKASYAVSFAKIERMLRRLTTEGFASFAEA